MQETSTSAIAKKAVKELPTLTDLHHDLEVAYKNDKLNLLLNQPCPAKWIKAHPTVKKKIRNPDGQEISVPAEYLPIDKVEYLLTRIFQVWKVEILREGQMFNSVYVTVRLHYINPVTGEWEFHDGIGAVGVQTDAGKSASDLGAIKQAAIMMALPAAESYAVKDAAEKLGTIFGSNLNRKDAIGFENGAYNEDVVLAKAQQIREAQNGTM